MNDLFIPEDQPIVFERDGEVYANSRDVADYFEKRHDNVLRDIKKLVLEDTKWGFLNFEEALIVHPQNKQRQLTFDITRDGFTLLVMSFTGSRANEFKRTYIERFNDMEQTLKVQTPAVPQTLIEALQFAVKQQEQITQMKPAVVFVDNYVNQDGLSLLSNAGKNTCSLQAL